MMRLLKLLKRDRAAEPSLFVVAEEQFAEWRVELVSDRSVR